MADTRQATAALTMDQYELTMAASHHAQGRNATATFDLFVRRLPPERQFLIMAGLEDALTYLENFCFEAADIDYLRSLEVFTEDFLDYLSTVRFTGDVDAVPEGEAVFSDAPLMRVTAPLIEAQIVETALLAMIGHQSAIASKAARVALACGERSFMDFAARRTHGPEAALTGARAAYMAGAAATSNVAAGKRYGIPLAGTMAHSYVMSYGDEREAFRRFARDLPAAAVLLIDTYDTVQGAHHAVQVAHELAQDGLRIQGVRLDSGDLASLSVAVRGILDAGGLTDVRIVASSDLDEYRIAALLAGGAPIDAFGVGTQMGVSADVPALGAVYKLAEYDGNPVQKLSPHKSSLPGIKQVWRHHSDGDIRDTVGLATECDIPGRPLLVPAMRSGSAVAGVGAGTLAQSRSRCAAALSDLPDRLTTLARADAEVPVTVSPALAHLATQVRDFN